MFSLRENGLPCGAARALRLLDANSMGAQQ